ncbi:hypothetical protein BDF19DRAFT_438133 [Syncephalis fuscata]|nr:hypothetical protein BDF19DRAFT_438133 [Syncephalis fuscata]
MFGVFMRIGSIRQVDQTLKTGLTKLTWGEEIVNGLDSASLDLLNQISPVWCFQPTDTWQFTPKGGLIDFNSTAIRNYTDITLTITPNPTVNTTEGMNNVQHEIQVVLLEDSNALLRARSKHEPIDIMTISNSLKLKTKWRQEQFINFRQYEVQSGKKTTIKYDAQSALISTPANVAHITILPQNIPTSDGKHFLYERRRKQANFSWLDFYGSIGGALTVSLSSFAFLFGQRRLRPWGVIQRFVFRNRILGKFPKSVVEINTMFMPKKKTSTEHENANKSDSNIDNHNNNRQSAFLNLSVDSAERTMVADNESLVQEVAQLKALIRFAELESFRQRVESFYLADDIFVKHDDSKEKQQSKSKVIAELNW